MLRTQNISGPLNADKGGYNQVVSAINQMQREQAKLLQEEYNKELLNSDSYIRSYSTFNTAYEELQMYIKFIDVLIANF